MIFIRVKFIFCFVFALVFAVKSPTLSFDEKHWEIVDHKSNLPYFGSVTKDEKKALLKAIDHSLTYLNRKASIYAYPITGVTHDVVKKSLERFRELLETLSGSALDQAIKNEFHIVRSLGLDEKGKILFTGYYEPIFLGSLVLNDIYKYPLYKTPKDLVKNKQGKILGRKDKSGHIVPYWTRKEIETGNKLAGQGLELVYLKDPYEVYMVHMQGSATIKLPDGKLMRVGFAAKNKRDYLSVAKELLIAKKIGPKEMTPQSIRRFFREHPEDVLPYLHKNDSYVFFMEKQAGPNGALAVPLTPQFSIALDKELFPKACLCFINTHIPYSHINPKKKSISISHFAMNQDCGGAIKGAGRCDIFFGSGKTAEELANSIYSSGQLYFLFLKK